MTIYVIQAYCGNKWLDCYQIKDKQYALEHMAYMNQEYPRKHRIVEVKK